MSSYKKILFTGASGRFGSKFRSYFNSKNYIYPKRKDLNITIFKSIERYLDKYRPKILVHCAALSRPMDIHESNISKSILTNIIGTCNLVVACEKRDIKLIYFSTNYVYPGVKGNYSEKSNLLPINNYGWSKLGGECAVHMYKNSLILRICMTEKPFIHKKAFKNVKTNFIFHEEVVKILPKLFKYKGIINVGGPIQSIFQFAKKSNFSVKGVNLKKSKRKDIKLNPSMNIRKLNKILND
tara:strand:- start:1831 stop:2550 length:720 start_codon:yes stop_codon:yes gene_type:complete